MNTSSPTPAPEAVPAVAPATASAPITESLRGRSLVALSMLVAALGFLAYWTPRLYPRSLDTGHTTDTVALVFLGAAAIVLGAVALALFLVGCIRWAFGDEQRRTIQELRRSLEQTDQQLALIADRLLISEAAKRIAYREQDRQALRQAIEEDLQKGDFDAALVLVNEMSRSYGYAAEAEHFRERIHRVRAASIDAKITQAIAGLDQMLEAAEWDKASAEAAKIQRLYPDMPQTRDLGKRVKDAWQARKHDLERRLLQSASHDDVEGAMELLRELDRYLTPEEAAPFLEVARGVIGKKRQNQGVQFKLAIQDRDWTQAVAVGEQIIREFPNTKMADEVRSTIDILRERAAGQRAAERANEPVA